MSRREAPALKLTIENGRLVPASAWDQERLQTYRNRSTINAYITQEKPRWMERKYWAILDRVITTCGVKQRTAEDLHDHIKLKLGFVNAKFDDNGKLKVTLKSTKLMEDPEYEGYFNEAMGFLFDMTGVDPMTLKKESADVGDEEPEPSDSPSDAGRDAATPSAENVAAQPNPVAKATEDNAALQGHWKATGGPGVASRLSAGSGTGALNSDGELNPSNPAGAPDDSVSVGASTSDTDATLPADAADQAGEESTGLSASPAECIAKMLATALDKTITPQEAAVILADSADMWLGVFSDARKPFVQAVFTTTKKVLRGELKPEAAKRYLEGLAA